MKANLFRIQSAIDGRGPFRPGFSQFWTEDSDQPSLPSIMEEFSQKDLNKFICAPGHKGCGVRLLTDLNKWFTKREQTALAHLRFHAVELFDCEIIAESPNQVVFTRLVPLASNLQVHPWPAL